MISSSPCHLPWLAGLYSLPYIEEKKQTQENNVKIFLNSWWFALSWSWALSARHLSITNPNFHKPSESRSPESESNALTKHWKGSLGLQDWLNCILELAKFPVIPGGHKVECTHSCTFTPSVKEMLHQNVQRSFALQKHFFFNLTSQNGFGIIMPYCFIFQMLVLVILIISKFWMLWIWSIWVSCNIFRRLTKT